MRPVQGETGDRGEKAPSDAELEALAAVAGLALPPGSHDGVRLHLAVARRMLATIEASAGAGDGLALAPVFRVDDDANP